MKCRYEKCRHISENNNKYCKKHNNLIHKSRLLEGGATLCSKKECLNEPYKSYKKCLEHLGLDKNIGETHTEEEIKNMLSEKYGSKNTKRHQDRIKSELEEKVKIEEEKKKNMIDNITYCKICDKKMINSKYVRCEECREKERKEDFERRQNMKLDNINKVKEQFKQNELHKQVCKFSDTCIWKPTENGVCSRHQKSYNKQQLILTGARVCVYKLCCNILDETENPKLKKCLSCREKYRIIDKRRDENKERKEYKQNLERTDKLKETRKNWRYENRDKTVEYNKEYVKRQKNKDENMYKKYLAAKMVEYRKNNKDVMKKIYEKSKCNPITYYDDYVRNANERNLNFELTNDEFEKYINNECHYCGYKHETFFNGIDRKDNDIGYNRNNCVSCCKICNMMKRIHNYDKFIRIVKHIITYNKMNDKTIKNTNYINYDVFDDCKGTDYSDYKRRAKKKNLHFEFNENEFNNIRKNKCYICGKENSNDHFNGVDRIDNIKGYIKDNVASCCMTCNYLKRDLEYDKFMYKLYEIYNKLITNNGVNMNNNINNEQNKINKKIKYETVINKIKKHDNITNNRLCKRSNCNNIITNLCNSICDKCIDKKVDARKKRNQEKIKKKTDDIIQRKIEEYNKMAENYNKDTRGLSMEERMFLGETINWDYNLEIWMYKYNKANGLNI